ncbi:MAG TPA: CAP domain-containing protein [Actinomycetota bacterium]|nr:CAP domain-containing protein [Actinomycetota bacterium]
MKTLTIRALVAAGTLSTIVLAGVAPASASPSEESCFFAAINSERTAAGLSAVTNSGALATMAEAWSGQLAAAGSLSHNPSLTNQAPSDWQYLGENVGEGPDCSSLVTAFFNSPEHKANILQVHYTEVGIGVVDGAGGTIWVTEDFMGTSAPAPAQPAPAAVGSPAPSTPVRTAADAPAPSTPAPSTPVRTPAAAPAPSTPAASTPAQGPVHTPAPARAAIHGKAAAPVPATDPGPAATAPAPAASTPAPVVTPAPTATPVVDPEPSTVATMPTVAPHALRGLSTSYRPGRKNAIQRAAAIATTLLRHLF